MIAAMGLQYHRLRICSFFTVHFCFYLFLALSSTLCTGCGLIIIPQVTTLPPAHFRTLHVCDAETKSPLDNASVNYEGHYGTNWMRCFPVGAQLASFPYTNEPGDLQLSSKSIGNGSFQFTPVSRLEWTHVWFPLGLPLGGIMFHYYSNSVIVSAPGYVSVRVYGERRPVHSFKSTTADEKFLSYSEHLTVLLPKEAQTKISPSTTREADRMD